MHTTRAAWLGLITLCTATASAEPLTIESAGGVSLSLDPDRIAVLTPAVRGENAADLARATVELAGLAVAESRAWAIPGWTLLTVAPPEGADERAAMESRLEALADAGVWASPVFVGLNGGPVWATPTLLASALPADAEMFGRVTDADWWGGAMIRSNARHGLGVLDQADALDSREQVEWAEPDMVFTGRSALLPNDSLFGTQWAMNQVSDFDVDAPEAWDITTGDAGIHVMIIDTGVDQTHPDLNQLPGYDFTSDNGDGGPVNSFDRHGTPVAGCVSAIINNAIGVAGLAGGCPSVSARCFISINSNGNWTTQGSWSVNAIATARATGVRVTNNSNFYGFAPAGFESQINDAKAEGIVHFSSAGNDGSFGSTYPASLPTVNSIAASQSSGTLASFSNFGTDIFLTAPGRSVRSTDNQGSSGYITGDYVYVSGTSFAAPTTAAAAALVLSVDPSLSAPEVEQILADSADPFVVPGFEGWTGAGHLNAFNAVSAAQGDACLADVNMNGQVEPTDFGAWLAAFNAGDLAADQNEDGQVTPTDFGAWLANFNAGCD